MDEQEKPIQNQEGIPDPDNKLQNDIESIERIQPSFKGISNFDKKKIFHQKPGYFGFNNHNYYQNHQNYPSNYSNQNTMGKNRTNSEKFNTRVRYQNQNYSKNNYNDIRVKNFKFNQKKRNQDSFHNNDHNHRRVSDDEKLEFINPYEEAKNYSNYDEFDKLPNLNFLKQNSKQKKFHEEEKKDINYLGQNNNNNLYNNIQNQNMINPLKQLNALNQMSQFKLGNNNMSLLLMNYLNNQKIGGNKQIINNLQIQNSNKSAKNNNNQILPNISNFSINSVNINNNLNMTNLNQAKLKGINNLNNLNIALALSQMNPNNQIKNFNNTQQNNNAINLQMPSQTIDNHNNINPKSPQKISQINNKNLMNANNNTSMNNNININVSEKFNSSMNSLVQAYYKSLQYQQIILNQMILLFNNNNLNSSIYNEIQSTANLLKNNINKEMQQMSSFPGININNNSSNESNDNNNKEELNDKKNNNNTKESDKSDKYIQNILSTWPEQKFYKSYSPLLKLEKNQLLLKPTNYLNNSIFTNPTLNINTMSMPYSNLVGVNFNQNINLNETDFKKKEIYDDQKINQYIKEGKCLTGIFRMNQSHNHGYITVQGIDNDILIRGKNLYECLNLDEVVIELLDCNKWKALLNKKNNRKFSFVHDDNLKNNKQNNKVNLDDFNSREERLNYINKNLKDSRPEGKIIKILRSPNKEKEQICTIQIEKNRILAVPIDESIPKILINIRNISKKLIANIDNLPNKYILSYYSNDLEKDYKNYKTKYFFVKIHSFVSGSTFKGPLGYIVNEIGASGNIDVESQVLLNLNNVNYTDKFSDDIMNEVEKKINEIKITDEYIKETNRADFRNELVFTIDPYTSKDLDDAIHVKVIDEKTQLLEIGVHIADPTTYVDVDSLLDKEALDRATSVYLVQKKISMLPLKLSDDVCSIMPGKDTLTISCIFRIYLANGSLDKEFEPYFTLSVVNSKAKWDYDLVQKMIEKKEISYDDLKFEDGSKPQSEEIFNKLKKSVEILYQLTHLVSKERYESGSLMIENDDIEFELDKNNSMPIDFHITHKNEAHSLVEELMLISNLLCAKFIYSHMKEYSLIRRHPFFNDKNYNEIQRYFSVNNICTHDFDDTNELNEILKEIKEKNINEYKCVQQKLKFLQLRAEYIFADSHSKDELRHSSLNYDLYTHFTSPIRRYPDMIVHRQLKEIFNYLKNPPSEKPYKKFEKYLNSIEHINKRYNSARMISLKSKRLFQCLYLKNAPKKKYKAFIMDFILNNNNNKKNINNNNNQSNNFMNNWNTNNMNNNNEEDELNLMLFVPELNMEIEWKKPDNEEIVCLKYTKEKNYLYIDYMEGNLIKNKYLRNFDPVVVEIFAVDSVPIDVKCKIDFSS